MDLVKVDKIIGRIMRRLYGISFGDEEYLGKGFKIAGGILIELVDDRGIGDEFRVDVIDDKHLVFKKNSELCWYSLVSREVNLVYLAYILENMVL